MPSGNKMTFHKFHFHGGRKHLVSVAVAKTWPEKVAVSNEDAADSTEDMIEQLTSKAAFGPSFSTFGLSGTNQLIIQS